MPRGKPFSGKQKKKQLQEKRDRKKGPQHGHHRDDDNDDENQAGDEASGITRQKGRADVVRINQQPINSSDFDPNR
jgi:hypothetical protein